MKLRPWLSIAVLLGLTASVYAQPYGYMPPAGPYGSAPPMQPLPSGPQAAGPEATQTAPMDPRQAMRERLASSPMVQASNTLKEGMDKLLSFLGQDEAPNKLQVAAFLDKEIAPYFDFDYMAKWVAGPGYGRMNPEQRKALASRLEANFLGGLSSQLASYEGQQVRILRPRMGPRGAVVVNVGILRPGAYPAKMQFRMYKAPSGWKVYDVVANGRSVSSYYRVLFQRTSEL
jgi:phospholipid transport system substrate-binding protein